MKVDNRDIFEQIGNLFYSIAADQHIKSLEVAELKMLISKEWLPPSSQAGEFPLSEEAHSIFIAMDTMQANQNKATEAYQEFARFFGLHPEVFTTELKRNIYRTAEEIVELFKADNFKENTRLSALKDLFDFKISATR